MTKLRTDYINKGKVVFSYRQYPLPFHPHAQKAAEASVCAGELGKFWEMHDAIFQNIQQIEVPALKERAKKVGLKQAKFDSCLDSGKLKESVEKDASDGAAVGIRGTPGFVVGKVDHKNKTVTGKIISGAYPFQTFKDQIEESLKAID